MKCRLTREMTLVIYPIDPVEHYAMKKWLEDYKEGRVKLEFSFKIGDGEKETHEVPYRE